jgi:hypothetical protein
MQHAGQWYASAPMSASVSLPSNLSIANEPGFAVHGYESAPLRASASMPTGLAGWGFSYHDITPHQSTKELPASVAESHMFIGTNRAPGMKHLLYESPSIESAAHSAIQAESHERNIP